MVQLTVAPPSNVVLTCPDEPHRIFAAGRFGDRGYLHDVVRVRCGAPAKRADGSERVDEDLRGRESQRCSGVRLVPSLRLAAGPDFAFVGAQPTHRSERLHRSVRAVGELEYSIDAFAL